MPPSFSEILYEEMDREIRDFEYSRENHREYCKRTTLQNNDKQHTGKGSL